MWGLFRSFALFSLMAVLLGITVAQSNDTSTPSLDFMVALDVSGSMDYATDRNRYPSVDKGLRVLVDQRIIGESRPATDPNALRFTTTETVLEWLAAYGRQYPDKINLSAGVVSFSDGAQSLMEWQTLRRSEDSIDTFTAPLSRSSVRSATTDQPQNANFVALYDILADQFSDRDPDNRRAVILVTDSVPCFPTGVRDPSAPLYDAFCTDIPAMVRHINALDNLGTAVEHVIFINPLGAEHWGSSTFQTVKEAWERRLTSAGGSFREIPSIDALPAAMMDVTMRELGVALGVINTDTSRPNDPVTADQYTTMGMSYSSSGVFAVPPFQSYMDVLTLLPAPSANFSLTTPQNADAAITTLYATDSEIVRIGRVVQPVPGSWNANAPLPLDTPTWAMFRAGEAALTIDGDLPAQYGVLRFRYTLTDHTGTPFRFTQETLPNILLEVTPPGAGSQTIELTDFSIAPDENALISPPILAFSAGSYRLALTVTEGDGAIWRTVANYAFLQPDRLPSVNITGVEFVADYTVLGRVTASTDTSTAVNMPRSLPLEIRLKANPESDLSEGLAARVIFTPPQDTNTANVCPADPINMGITPEDRSQAVSPPIRFADDGVCELSIEVTFTSPLPPLNGATETISTGNRRTVTVTPTQRLMYRLLQADGKTPVSTDADTASYTLNAPNDLGFTPNQLRLRVEVLDENGRLTEPIFLEGEAGPNRQNCRVPSVDAPLPSVEGETPAEPLTADVSGQKVVPFRLVVTNSAAQDVAAANGICLYATDLAGVYQGVLSGLVPDTYTVQVVLDNQSPRLDYERFEWHPDLFKDGFNIPHQVSALIQVNPNLIVWGVYGGAAVAALVLMILIGVLIRRRQQSVTAPLNGWPTLYRVDEDALLLFERAPNSLTDEPQEPAWTVKPTRSNTVSYQASDFLNESLIPLGIEMLTLTTKRQMDVSQNGSFYYEMKRRNGIQKPDNPLEPNQVIELAQVESGSRFFLVNRVSESQTFTLGALLTQRRAVEQADKDEGAS